MQTGLVERRGQVASGVFAHSVSYYDITTGWWEGEAVFGRGQERTFAASLKDTRENTF